MGFGLPAAIGAKVGAPEKIVVDIDGDASFSMTAMELATASQYNIGVKVLLMNNEFQGMVEQWQGKSSFFETPLTVRSILRESILAYTNDQP
jgi:thiamine pyrophosphate-dependent acetolactate synthase large subunit-like protein